MEQAVNDCRDNLLIKVREYYPAIKPEDYQLLVYLASGLSTRTASLLLGESVDVIYKRKSRLKARLKENAASGCPDIMSVFKSFSTAVRLFRKPIKHTPYNQSITISPVRLLFWIDRGYVSNFAA